MKTRKPLKRKAPLQARTPLRSKRTPKKPKRLPAPTAEFWQEQRLVIFNRARGLCEHCGRDLNVTGLQAHHRKLRSQGGGHGVENLAALCPECHHDRIHAHPVYAKERGFIVPSGADPAHRAVVLHDGRTVRFATDGTYDECWTDEGEAA